VSARWEEAFSLDYRGWATWGGRLDILHETLRLANSFCRYGKAESTLLKGNALDAYGGVTG